MILLVFKYKCYRESVYIFKPGKKDHHFYHSFCFFLGNILNESSCTRSEPTVSPSSSLQAQLVWHVEMNNNVDPALGVRGWWGWTRVRNQARGLLEHFLHLSVSGVKPAESLLQQLGLVVGLGEPINNPASALRDFPYKTMKNVSK